MNRRIVKLAVTALALALLIGCSGAPQSSTAAPPPITPIEEESTLPIAVQPVRMGVVIPEGGHNFTADSLRHAEAELAALAAAGEFEYTLLTGADVAAQQNAVAKVLEEHPDVVVLWPIEGDTLRESARSVLETGARLIIYDRLIDDFYPTASIAGDNATIGNWTGQYLLRTFEEELAAGGEVHYLRFVGALGAGVSQLRSAGMEEAVAAAGFAEQFVPLREDYETHWTADEAGRQMTEFLSEATPEELESLDCIITHDDEMVDGVVAALEGFLEENPGAPLGLRIITGVGGRRETLALFDDGPIAGAELLTYHFSPAFIRQAIQLGVASARNTQYDGADISGQTFLIPTIEIDRTLVTAYRAGREYAERYTE